MEKGEMLCPGSGSRVEPPRNCRIQHDMVVGSSRTPETAEIDLTRANVNTIKWDTLDCAESRAPDRLAFRNLVSHPQIEVRVLPAVDPRRRPPSSLLAEFSHSFYSRPPLNKPRQWQVHPPRQSILNYPTHSTNGRPRRGHHNTQ